MSSTVFEAVDTQETRLAPQEINLTDSDINSLHRDDAMASGMIAVILSIAFVVLLGLVVSVSVWTMRVTA